MTVKAGQRINFRMDLRTLPRSRFRGGGAFTLIELLVVISIIAVLATLALPAITGALVKSQMTRTLSNYKQLWEVSQIAHMDFVRSGSSNSGFPGDCGSFTIWSNTLVPAYLSPQSFLNLISVKNDVGNTRIWNASADSPSSDVMISTRNVSGNSNSLTLDNQPPYNLNGGIVVNVSGQAMMILVSQANGPNTFPPNVIPPEPKNENPPRSRGKEKRGNNLDLGNGGKRNPPDSTPQDNQYVVKSINERDTNGSNGRRADEDRPPSVKLAASPIQVPVNTPVKLTIEASDPDGDHVSILIDPSDGNLTTLIPEKEYSCVFDTCGEKIIKVTGDDGRGMTDTNTTSVVVINSNPAKEYTGNPGIPAKKANTVTNYAECGMPYSKTAFVLAIH